MCLSEKIHAKVIAGNRYRCDRFACRWAKFSKWATEIPSRRQQELCGAGSLTRPRRATLGYWVSTEAVELRSTGQPGGSRPCLGRDCVSIASEGWMVGAVGFEPTTSTV